MAQTGRTFIVEVNTVSTTWVPVGGLRAKTITQNRQTIDVTNSDHTDLQRRLLAGGGVYSLTFSGSGILEDTTADTELNTLVASGAHKNFRITLPGLFTWSAAFQVTSYEITGSYDGAVEFSMTIESAGTVTVQAL